MCYQLEKLMKDNADKLRESDRESLQKAISKTKEAAKSDNVETIRTAVNELEQASHAFSKTLYEKNGAAGEGAAPPTGNESAGGDKPGDDAIDAEYEVKKD